MKFLQYLVNQLPCSRGPGCHVAVCVFGHVCQTRKCIGFRGRGGNCALKIFHQARLVIADWVLAYVLFSQEIDKIWMDSMNILIPDLKTMICLAVSQPAPISAVFSNLLETHS